MQLWMLMLQDFDHLQRRERLQVRPQLQLCRLCMPQVSSHRRRCSCATTPCHCHGKQHHNRLGTCTASEATTTTTTTNNNQKNKIVREEKHNKHGTSALHPVIQQCGRGRCVRIIY